jgi:hypothetical protein
MTTPRSLELLARLLAATVVLVLSCVPHAAGKEHHDVITTEGLLVRGFRLETLMPVQRARCCIGDGLPLGNLAHDPNVVTMVGGENAIANLPSERGVVPKIQVDISSIRSAKTMTAVARAVRQTNAVSVDSVKVGETVRVAIVSLTLARARNTFNMLRGLIESSALRSLLVGEPTAESLFLRHPTGRPILIEMVHSGAGARGLVGDWSAGVIVDEAPRMAGRTDATVNLDDVIDATIGRLLPGASIQLCGSPWAPFGTVYDLVQEHFGKPTPHIVVLRSTGPQNNPHHWTPERCASLERTNPTAYRTDVMGEFLDPESSLINPLALRRNSRQTPLELPPLHGHNYSAAIDPSEGSASGNAWTLVIVERYDDENQTGDVVVRHRVALAKEWRGLGPDATLAAVAHECRRYGLRKVWTDQYAASANIALAHHHGLELVVHPTSATSKIEAFTNLATLIHSDRVELPPDRTLRRDLLGVKLRVTQQGRQIVLPKTSDGRHCDFAPALAAALKNAGAFRRRPTIFEAIQNMNHDVMGQLRREQKLREEGYAV